MSPSLYCLCVRKKILNKDFALNNVDEYFSKRKKDTRLIIKLAILNNLEPQNILDIVFSKDCKHKQLSYFKLTTNIQFNR